MGERERDNRRVAEWWGARPQGCSEVVLRDLRRSPGSLIISPACCGLPNIWSGWKQCSHGTLGKLGWGAHLCNLILSLLQFVRLVGPQQPRLRFPLLLQCGLCILPALPCLHALVEGSLWGRAVGRSTVSSLVALADSALEGSSPSSCVGEALARVGSAATVSAQLGHLMSKSTSLDQALFKLPVGQCHATQGWMAGGTVGSLMSIPDTNVSF